MGIGYNQKGSLESMEEEGEAKFLQLVKEKQNENKKEGRKENSTGWLSGDLLRQPGFLVEVGQRVLPLLLEVARGVSA